MKSNVLVAAAAFAAGFVLVQAADESGEVVSTPYDGTAATEPATSGIVLSEPATSGIVLSESAVGEPEPAARDSERELADLREQIARDMMFE